MGQIVSHTESVDAFYSRFNIMAAGRVSAVIHRNVTLSDDGSTVEEVQGKWISIACADWSQIDRMTPDHALSLGWALIEAVGAMQGDPREGRPTAVVMRADEESEDPDRWIVQIDTHEGTGRLTVYLNDSDDALYEGDPEKED